MGDVAAILSIGAGVIHISAAGDHTELPVMFAGFMLVAALQIALGALLLRRPPSRLIIAAAVAMTLSSIGLWVLSRTAGLPFIEGGHRRAGRLQGRRHEAARDREHPDAAPAAQPGPRPGLASVTPARRPDARGRGNHVRRAAGAGAPAGRRHPPFARQAVALGIHDEHDGSDTAAHGGSAAAHTDGEPRRRGARASARTTRATDDHTHAANATGGHHTLLASAPLGATHEHGAAGTPGDAPTHHSDQHGEDRHQVGRHPHHRGGKHHGGDHGHGEHGSPDAEPAISVTYEPEPSVCISGALCVP